MKGKSRLAALLAALALLLGGCGQYDDIEIAVDKSARAETARDFCAEAGFSPKSALYILAAEAPLEAAGSQYTPVCLLSFADDGALLSADIKWSFADEAAAAAALAQLNDEEAMRIFGAALYASLTGAEAEALYGARLKSVKEALTGRGIEWELSGKLED